MCVDLLGGWQVQKEMARDLRNIQKKQERALAAHKQKYGLPSSSDDDDDMEVDQSSQDDDEDEDDQSSEVEEEEEEGEGDVPSAASVANSEADPTTFEERFYEQGGIDLTDSKRPFRPTVASVKAQEVDKSIRQSYSRLHRANICAKIEPNAVMPSLEPDPAVVAHEAATQALVMDTMELVEQESDDDVEATESDAELEGLDSWDPTRYDMDPSEEEKALNELLKKYHSRRLYLSPKETSMYFVLYGLGASCSLENAAVAIWTKFGTDHPMFFWCVLT